MLLLGKAAEKGKRKVERSTESATEDPRPLTSSDDADAQANSLRQYEDIMFRLFAGPPCTEEARRPPRPLTNVEKCYGFRWRLLCDAAFQEDKPEIASLDDLLLPPLCMVDFCWNNYDYAKWTRALSLLMVTKCGAELSPTEQALHFGEIGDAQ